MYIIPEFENAKASKLTKKCLNGCFLVSRLVFELYSAISCRLVSYKSISSVFSQDLAIENLGILSWIVGLLIDITDRRVWLLQIGSPTFRSCNSFLQVAIVLLTLKTFVRKSILIAWRSGRIGGGESRRRTFRPLGFLKSLRKWTCMRKPMCETWSSFSSLLRPPPTSRSPSAWWLDRLTFWLFSDFTFLFQVQLWSECSHKVHESVGRSPSVNRNGRSDPLSAVSRRLWISAGEPCANLSHRLS